MRKSPRISWKETDDGAPLFVSCVYEADVALLRYCMKTLHEKNSRPPAALLVGDSREAVLALQRSFADAGRAVEIAYWEDLLGTLPEKSQDFVWTWLKGGPFGGYAKKFAVTLAANRGRSIVMCDADVLFGGDFFASLGALIREKNGIMAGEDYRASYDVKTAAILEEPRILGDRPLNCGLVYYPESLLNETLHEEFLQQAAVFTSPPDNHLEQTLIAYVFWKKNGMFFTSQMLETSLADNLKWGRGLNSQARHYAGGKHLFWRDA